MTYRDRNEVPLTDDDVVRVEREVSEGFGVIQEETHRVRFFVARTIRFVGFPKMRQNPNYVEDALRHLFSTAVKLTDDEAMLWMLENYR
jgi:hypothetical protein